MPSPAMTPEQALPQISAILARGGRCRLVVTGTSMLPFLRHKQDAVILAPLSGPVRRGDILFYLRAGGQPILHRVVKLCDDGTLLLCGDAQVALEPISPAQVMGRVEQMQRGEKLFSVSSPAMRLGGELWMLLRPVRPYLLAAARKLGFLK